MAQDKVSCLIEQLLFLLPIICFYQYHIMNIINLSRIQVPQYKKYVGTINSKIYLSILNVLYDSEAQYFSVNFSGAIQSNILYTT